MKRRAQTASDEIPTSSMADIAFLLIIYFLVTTTFNATRGLDFALPHDRDEPQTIEPVRSVLVEVRPNGELRVDSRPLALRDLLSYLEPKLLKNPEKPVIIKTAAAAPYGAMVDVLDELRQGRERLGLEQDIMIAIPIQREQNAFWL